ncbi:hypothetical protein CONPUDRAFT_154079 [Coniophora puteana RWD-64-598 SS2]|uniref:Thiamine pyrophosphate enzyme N-terminal TPP-binding domain-containing protein n=1 Tax=Coniophora puteana (strain RWD-64-598) TaxID=741705 RepID=A0A5M3MS24_CONPW|nr:uncharacterized protein CONPUDRAFT_154079 [Coniophora puteana RWD-64-598 SS2]EIW81544.1 hypothetical protein CONPUDRAFT_154079 [Coniophora puteana RWD-64-598 SS2]
MFTTSSLFLHTLAQVGITHAFVNWGSDHPALLEDLERQRVQYGRTRLEIIICPNEMVALSAAQGYAQVTGKPAAVIVHVGIGTQALAGALHNVDVGRTPVLIYAGASPFTCEGELKGSRNEWIMWMQDIPDQTQAVRQHMRYTAQIESPVNLTQVVRRALQIATSEPQGPVYLWARREVMEQEIDESLMKAPITMYKWPAICPAGLSPVAVSTIASALLTAHRPLILTSHIGRMPSAISPLLALSTLLAVPIVSVTPSTTNCPHSFPYFLGTTILTPGTHTPLLRTADVVLAIEVGMPWIPMNRDSAGNFERPSEDARVFVLDGGDPLKGGIGMWHVDAELVARADSEVALTQLLQATKFTNEKNGALTNETVRERSQEITRLHDEWIARMDAAEAFESVPRPLSPDTEPLLSSFTASQIIASLRRAIEASVPRGGALILNESVTNFAQTWGHTRAEGRFSFDDDWKKPCASSEALSGASIGSVITSGGSSLGWGIGAGVGSILGSRVVDAATATCTDTPPPTPGTGVGTRQGGYDFVAAVVGDGSYMFGVPSSTYWMARKYDTPFLTLILNNSGWSAPKASLRGVYPNGYGSHAPGEVLSVGFGPHVPDHAGVAVAASAGWVWGRHVSARGVRNPGVYKEVQVDGVEETRCLNPAELLDEVMREAVRVVFVERRCAVLDCVLESI